MAEFRGPRRKWRKLYEKVEEVSAFGSGHGGGSVDGSDGEPGESGGLDYVTVEVKNTEGGAIIAYYLDENEDNVYLPIGEKVKIPRGTKQCMQ